VFAWQKIQRLVCSAKENIAMQKVGSASSCQAYYLKS